jgi:hypothetical protein
MSESQHKFFRRNIELRRELGYPVTATVLERLTRLTKSGRRSMWLYLLAQKAGIQGAKNPWSWTVKPEDIEADRIALTPPGGSNARIADVS